MIDRIDLLEILPKLLSRDGKRILKWIILIGILVGVWLYPKQYEFVVRNFFQGWVYLMQQKMEPSIESISHNLKN